LAASRNLPILAGFAVILNLIQDLARGRVLAGSSGREAVVDLEFSSLQRERKILKMNSG
jgi:hypothetical protein